MSSSRMPAFYISHGGGPYFFMEAREGSLRHMDKHSATAQWYREFASRHVPRKPSAIVVVSAHWEERDVRVIASPQPSLYFDYYGFPEHTYQLTYPAPGDPALASRVITMLARDGITASDETRRGWDHGVFIPLLLMYPDADVPIVQVSLMRDLNPSRHIQIGRALESLRDEDVLIIGSGFSTHNMRASGDRTPTWASEWVQWLTETVSSERVTPEERYQRLVDWHKAPGAEEAHPREEHLIPLHVAAGSASLSVNAIAAGETIYDLLIGAWSFLMFKFP